MEHYTTDAAGRVTEEREKLLRDLVADAVANRVDDATVDSLTAAVWATFQERADLSRPKGDGSGRTYTRRDAERKVAYALKPNRAARLRPRGRAELIDAPPEYEIDEQALSEAEWSVFDAVSDWIACAIQCPKFDTEDGWPEYEVEHDAKDIIAVTAGVGKTHAALAAIARFQHWDDINARIARALFERGTAVMGGKADARPDDFPDERGRSVVWVCVPTVELARQQLKRFEAMGGRGRVIRGRLHGWDPDPDKRKEPSPCLRPEAVYALGEVGIHNVSEHVCKKRRKDPETGEWDTLHCPLYDDCQREGYYAQFGTEPGGVYFLSHQYLFATKPKALPKPDLVVIDEAVSIAHLPVPIPVDAILESAGEHRPLIETIIAALEEGDRAPDLDPDAIKAAVEALEAEVKDIPKLPNWPEDRIVAVAGQRYFPAALRLLKRAKEWTPGQEVRDATVEFVEYKTAGGKKERRRICNLQWRREFNEAVAEAPWLMLDATADEHLARLLYPEAMFHRIAARRNARVVQTYRQTGSKSAMIPDNDRGKSIRRRLGRLLELLESPGVVMTFKDAEEDVELPAGWRSAHFGGFRGQDWASDMRTAVVAGRPHPKAHEVRRLARALFWDQGDHYVHEASRVPLCLDEPLDRAGNTAGDWHKRPSGFVIRGGTTLDDWITDDDARNPGVKAWHSNGVVMELLRRQITEAEIVQAADRVRAVRAKEDEMKTIVLINEQPTPIPTDVLVAWDELMKGLEVRVAFARLDGFLPTNPQWLAAEFPDLWSSPKAAEHDIARYEDPRVDVGAELAEEMRPFIGLGRVPVWEFRVCGQRGRGRKLWTWHDETAARAWLTERFGEITALSRTN